MSGFLIDGYLWNKVSDESSPQPQKQGTVKFVCRINGLSELQEFKFRDCRLVPQIREYILRHRDLHYLKPQTVDNTSEKRKSKGKYRKTSSVYFSDF